MTARSYLYVPGDRPEMLAKAAGRGADALLLDLEDAVAPDRKAFARATVAEWLSQHPDIAAERWVRVNAEHVADDIAAVAVPGLHGVSVAKATTAVLAAADEALTAAERRHGLAVGSIGMIPLVESAEALLQLPELARHPRVLRLAVGEADLAADLRLRPSPGDPEFLPLRLQVVVASAAAGLQAPIGPVDTDFRDLDALRASTRRLSDLGFRARSAIHPAQVAVINEVLTPPPDEVEQARRLVERFEASVAAGSGATTGEDGRMIDAAVIRSARETLARAHRAGTA